MCNCQRNEKNIQLIRFEHLQFPSASAIEYNQGKIFVLGDDAPYLLALDTAYKTLDTVHYINDTSYRIAKNLKPDIESATIVNFHDQYSFLRLVLLPIKKGGRHLPFRYLIFILFRKLILPFFYKAFNKFPSLILKVSHR